MSYRPKLNGSVNKLFGRAADEEVHLLRFDVPCQLLDPRFLHPLLLWMLTEPHLQQPPLQFSQLAAGGFRDIKSRLLRSVNGQNLPGGGRLFYEKLFARAGTPLFKELNAFSSRPSDAAPTTADTAMKQDMLLYLFYAVNNLQSDDVPPSADTHAPHNTKIADYIFRSE